MGARDGGIRGPCQVCGVADDPLSGRVLTLEVILRRVARCSRQRQEVDLFRGPGHSLNGDAPVRISRQIEVLRAAPRCMVG